MKSCPLLSRLPVVTFLAWCCLGVVSAAAKPVQKMQELAAPDVEVDVVGDVDGTQPAPQKVLADTIWIATWTFDAAPGVCTDAGWMRSDNLIRNDGSLYWTVGTEFSGTGGIVGRAAILGTDNNPCCVLPDGYDNDWYQGIRLQYSGAGTLSFDYLLDSESGFDFLQVETDSACASFERVNHITAPQNDAAFYRSVRWSDSGYKLNGRVSNLSLRNYGPGVQCVYISFTSDGGYSPCDGFLPTTLGRALVVDNIRLESASGVYVQDFEGVVEPGLFVNLLDTKPFGEWGRLYYHITDNDVCTENTTCAWLWTDYITPSLAAHPSVAFGPDSYVVRNWLDNVIVSPWVSLASTPTASGTVIRFRRFGGNFFTDGFIVTNWSVGSKSTAGDMCDWGHATQWSSLSSFTWVTFTFDMTLYFDPSAAAVQVRHRVSDWQYIAGFSHPGPYYSGPGPYIDDTRIGRIILSGPVLSEGSDARTQAQDCFPTEINPAVTPAGEHYRPTTDRFGTCAFSEGTELGINRATPNLVTGDSIWIRVQDVRGAGGIAAVQWYGAIVSGPHAGKAPAPYAPGPNGFFVVTADSVRNGSGAVVAGDFFVDLDDTYFRGGDVVHYFWLARDAQGGFTSDPEGLAGVPASIADAEQATGGLLEVSFLPAIDWAPAYLARIAADPHGDLEPTGSELAASSQHACILYVQQVNTRRRSGDLNRTSFMYTLDRLGYRGHYDVYDHSGLGNTNNQLGGRATIQQAQGYNLIVYDAGNNAPGRPILPTGNDLEVEKVDQAGWFRSWLAQAPVSAAGFATLWEIASNTVEEHPTNALYTSTMGVGLVRASQGTNINPDVAGQSSFSFDTGPGANLVDFTTGPRALYAANGGCPTLRSYDGLSSSGTAARVYRYKEHNTGALSDGAIVMNSSPAENWNTILQSHAWMDIRDVSDGSSVSPPAAQDLLNAILRAVLPVACQRDPVPTNVSDPPSVVSAPARTALYPNTPNPFNPATTIRFDLAQGGRVTLSIYDVAGRQVRTLVDTHMTPGAGKSAVWDGVDDQGRSVATGLYFYRLEAPGFVATRKMLLVE